jgi:hypothetical protein
MHPLLVRSQSFPTPPPSMSSSQARIQSVPRWRQQQARYKALRSGTIVCQTQCRVWLAKQLVVRMKRFNAAQAIQVRMHVASSRATQHSPSFVLLPTSPHMPVVYCHHIHPQHFLA